MNSNEKRAKKQKQVFQPSQEDGFKQKLIEKFGQNIIYQDPNRYTQMKDFNQRNPSYGVTVEYNFLLKIQDCGLLESSQLQFFMNVFRKAYSDVKLAAASCYFFGDLIVTQSQATQPQQQPIIFKMDWKRPNVEEKPQEQNKIQEPPKTTIEKEFQSKQNMQLQNKQNSEENQKLSKDNKNTHEIEQNQQQNQTNSKKKQSQPPQSDIMLHNPPKQQLSHSEIPSRNFSKQQPPTQTANSQESLSNPPNQNQEPPNKQTTLSNPPQQQPPPNSQEIQSNSPKQQSIDSEEKQSNSQKEQKEYQQPVEIQTQLLKQEQHQPDQIKKQSDEKNNKSLQTNQSTQKQQVIGQVNQQTQKNNTQNQKQTSSNSSIITSQEGSTQESRQNDSITKKYVEEKQNQQVTQDQQNLIQIKTNKDFQVETDQNKQTVQQHQKEIPIVQAPVKQVQAEPARQVQTEPVKQVQAQPAKQIQAEPLNQKSTIKDFHFQITSQVIEQKPSKEILQTSQLGSLIKQFAEINNLSEDQLKNQDYWFFPINQQQTHWVSAVVQFKPKVIYYFDSYYEKTDDLILKGIYTMLDYYNLNSKEFQLTTCYNRQENCYDCGIFLLLSLLQTLRKKEYDYKQMQINKYRESILYKLAVIGAQVDIEKDFLEELIR